MPDALSAALEHTVEHGGHSYRFRRPAAKQMIAADVLAAGYRGGMPITSLTYSLALSEARASCNAYCVDPRTVANDGAFDFGDLDDVALIAVYNEVSRWLESFRVGVEKP